MENRICNTNSYSSSILALSIPNSSARRVREQGVYCEIVPFHYSVEKIIERSPKGVILSGGPSSVYDDDAPRVSPDFYEKIEAPILGICYGMQLMAVDLGGSSEPASRREYGHAQLKRLSGKTVLFENLPEKLDVWMSHGDHVTSLRLFHSTATTGDVITAIENPDRRIFAVQFHPEVSHTPQGKEVIKNFIFNICGCSSDWSASSFIADEVAEDQRDRRQNRQCDLRTLGRGGFNGGGRSCP